MDSTSFAPRPLAELSTLGVLGLRVGGIPRLERRRKSLAVLAFLARQAPTRFRRVELASLFWPSSREDRARQSLRQALAELRQAVGDALQSTADLAWVEPARLHVDVAALEAEMDAGRTEGVRVRLAAVFLDGCDGVASEAFDRWLAGEREKLAARASWLDEQTATSRTRPDTTETAIAVAAARAARRAAILSTPLQSCVPLPVVKDQVAALRAIDEAWQSACRGGAEAVLLEGDAGLGKSHVLEQFVSRVRADQPQAVCLVARGLESERRHQGGLVRQLLGTVPADAGLRAADLTVAPERLREAAAKVAGVVPLLVVVDDATLADDASQDALGALVEAPPAGALVLLASRPFMLSEVRFRAALQRNAALRRLALAPLQPAAAGELVRSLLTLEEPLAATLADRLCDERRGNPGLIAATLSVMMDEGYLVPGGTGWRAARELPAALPIATDPRERTRRLLPRLSAPARSALEAAAVPGDAVDLAVLAPVAALDAATLEVALQELVVRRLLRSSVRGEGWLEFTSGAVRLAVLDQLGLPRRRTLQRAHERAVRHRYGSRSREPIAYERPVRQQPGPLGLLRSTLAAAVGLLG